MALQLAKTSNHHGALMIGTIGIDHFAIECIIGVYPHERVKEQTIFVDVQVEWNIGSSISDDITDTLNYEVLASLCEDVAKKGEYRLLEAYVIDALEAIFVEFSPRKALIKVKKPAGLPLANYTFVALERTKNEG